MYSRQPISSSYLLYERLKTAAISINIKDALPPQQNPATPIVETPLLFRAAITAIASSHPLSFKKQKTHKFELDTQ